MPITRPCSEIVVSRSEKSTALGPGWSVLHGDHSDDACDLLDVRPFVTSQPARVEQYRPLERLPPPSLPPHETSLRAVAVRGPTGARRAARQRRATRAGTPGRDSP